MASAGARALPKMAAGGPARRAAGARGRSRTEPHGPALPGRRRPPGRSAKGSPEDGRPATASAEPAREAPAAARRQERGGPRRPSPVGGTGPGRARAGAWEGAAGLLVINRCNLSVIVRELSEKFK